MRKSGILKWAVVISMSTCCLNGCLNMTNMVDHKKKTTARTQSENTQPTRKAGASQADPVLEVKALLAQPYIDPLTRYIKRYADDPTRAVHVEQLEKERRLRCEKVAEDYQKRSKTTDNLQTMSDGYKFSCPEQVEAFATLVTDPANNECYLLTKLHNYREALEPCREPAEKGDARAQLNMAVISRALGNYETALHWATLAANFFPEASYLMGELYAQGQGTKQSVDKAVHWYELAAQKDHAGAQTALGMIYLKGTSVTPNPETARHWLLKAARKNDSQAFYHMGEMCEQNQNLADLPQAMVWYDLASQKGLQKAQERLVVLSRTVDMEKIPEAKRQVHRLLKDEPR